MKMQPKLYVLSALVISLTSVSCSAKKEIVVIDEVQSYPVEDAQLADDVVKGSLIISYDSEASLAGLKKAIETYGAEIVYEYNNFNMLTISVPQNKTDEQATQYFEKVKGVLSVERNRLMQIQN